jgi:hypothetical protein
MQGPSWSPPARPAEVVFASCRLAGDVLLAKKGVGIRPRRLG